MKLLSIYLSILLLLFAGIASNAAQKHAAGKKPASYAADMRFIRKAYANIDKSYSKMDANILSKYLDDGFACGIYGETYDKSAYISHLYNIFVELYNTNQRYTFKTTVYDIYYSDKYFVADLYVQTNAPEDEQFVAYAFMGYRRDYWIRTPKGLKIVSLDRKHMNRSSDH